MDVLLDLPTKVYYRLYDYLAMIGFASYVTSNQVNMHHRRLGTTPAYVDFSALAGISLVLFIMLKILKSISNSFKRKMKKRILKAIEDRKSNRDGFRSKYGYSWDFVIVFPIRDKNDKITDKQKKNSLKAVIDALADGGLETKQFYSIQHDELYVKVRAPLYRLMREADRINYNLLVNDVQLCNMLQEGRPGKWPSVSVPSWSIETDIDPFKYIYAPFEYDNTLKNAREDLVNLYQRYSGESIFRGVDRMKLILSIISARKFEGGCFVDLHRLVRDGCILGFTPIHDVVELRKLEEKWLRFVQFPWKQAVDHVKDYFGEKIGMYFLFLGHYTTWLISAGVVGFFAWIIVAAEGNSPNAAVLPYFAAFMSVWSTLFLEYWVRKEKMHAMKWGMVGFEEEEQERPKFKGDLIPSPVDGKLFMYFPRSEYMKRIVMSTSIVSGCILVVLGVVASIFVLRILLTSMKELVVGGTQTGGIIVSLVNAIQIQVLNMIYGTIAIKLNDFENHRTDTEYEDALIAKTFVFQFINSFSSLFYIAFVKPFIPNIDPCLDSCMAELSTSLGTIFMTRLAVGSVMEILLPYINNRAREKENLAGTGMKVTDMSEVERGFMQEEYHVMLGPFADFANISIQFGYTTMFVVAFPLAAVIAFISNYIEIRIGAWKLCQLSRRPEPRSAEDIGTWYTILELISFIAAIVNAGLIAFTSDITDGHTWVGRIWIFFGVCVILMSVKSFVQMITPDIPLDVDIQLERNKYYMDKILRDIPDEDDSLLTKNISINAEYAIRITDDDPL